MKPRPGRILPLILLFFAFFTPPALACTCAGGPFLPTVEINDPDNLVSLRVLAYEDVVDDAIPAYMDVEVTRQYRGTVENSEIRVYSRADGANCYPYVTGFHRDNEWILPLNQQDGEFFLPSCPVSLSVEGNEAVGYIRRVNFDCSQNPESGNWCGDITQEEYAEALNQRMDIEEFDIIQQAYGEGVAWGLEACRSPFSRCERVRASYDPNTGELILPAVDLLPPADSPLPFASGISAKMQQQEGVTPPTFVVTEAE